LRDGGDADVFAVRGGIKYSTCMCWVGRCWFWCSSTCFGDLNYHTNLRCCLQIRLLLLCPARQCAAAVVAFQMPCDLQITQLMRGTLCLSSHVLLSRTSAVVCCRLEGAGVSVLLASRCCLFFDRRLCFWVSCLREQLCGGPGAPGQCS
jgi:hypothetical protein